MEQILRSLVDPKQTREENVHAVREFLQILILKTLHEIGAFQNIAFVGGTALRILYQLQRFSEDLDFSVTWQAGYRFKDLVHGVRFHLKKMNLSVEIQVHEQKTVQSGFIKFVSILQQLGISRMKDEKLSIRIEVDSNPPVGWKNEMSLVNRIFVFPVRHFDLSSLFATKIHACVFRKYIKGRDYYDLMWYLSKKVNPNWILLNNAIQQTEHQALNINETNWKSFLIQKIEKLEFHKIQKDIEPFLVDPRETDLLNKEVFLKLIGATA